jgi:hypothetical protein
MGEVLGRPWSRQDLDFFGSLMALVQNLEP